MYYIGPLELQVFQLRLGKVVDHKSPLIIEEVNLHENDPTEDKQTKAKIKDRIKINNSKISSQPHHSKEKSLAIKEPPYRKRFSLEKADNIFSQDFLTELQNVCVKIPLLEARKYISIFTQIIRELCLKKLGRKHKDPLVIKIVGQ